MKKLMFGLAALVAATSFAAIESSNIVGYTNIGLRDGADMVTACFDKVGVKATFDLTELKPVGYDTKAGTIDEIIIDILTPGGTTEKQYVYIDLPGDFEPGWYLDYEPIAVGDCTIQAGSGLWMTAMEGISFTSAGQVITESRGVMLRDGAIGVGNLLARSVDLTELAPIGYDAEAGTIDEITLDILTPGGTTEVQYVYIDLPGDFEPGWYLDYEPVAEGDQSFAPGAGMWVTAFDGITLQFPAL